MSLPYCEKFGFDEARINQYLRWLNFSATDHGLAQRLQLEIIRPNLSAIIDDFYTWMDGVDELRKMLQDGQDIERLKVTQSGYLQSLGMDYNTPKYFESRLRVGQTHAWIGLNLSLYNCSYYWLSQFILAYIPSQLRNSDDGQKIQAFLHKIIALDISLAIETYHVAQVTSLEESLARTQQQKDRLQQAASTDSLTGLANHDTIISELEFALDKARKNHGTVAVVMADLDHFKRVNDTYGHLAGDKVLIEVAHRMRSALRGHDHVGRYGGEEFLMILYNATPESMQAVAERVRQRITANPIKSPDINLDITMSIGATLARPGEKADEAIARADAALYRAKDSGRNRVVVD